MSEEIVIPLETVREEYSQMGYGEGVVTCKVNGVTGVSGNCIELEALFDLALKLQNDQT